MKTLEGSSRSAFNKVWVLILNSEFTYSELGKLKGSPIATHFHKAEDGWLHWGHHAIFANSIPPKMIDDCHSIVVLRIEGYLTASPNKNPGPEQLIWISSINSELNTYKVDIDGTPIIRATLATVNKRKSMFFRQLEQDIFIWWIWKYRELTKKRQLQTASTVFGKIPN